MKFKPRKSSDLQATSDLRWPWVKKKNAKGPQVLIIFPLSNRGVWTPFLTHSQVCHAQEAVNVAGHLFQAKAESVAQEVLTLEKQLRWVV